IYIIGTIYKNSIINLIPRKPKSVLKVNNSNIYIYIYICIYDNSEKVDGLPNTRVGTHREHCLQPIDGINNILESCNMKNK
ncbi:hypothetical protein BJ944DRAFT_166856, partial [Cunninghamella echinulata]